MKKAELKKLASEIKDLELKCQKGENISENEFKIQQLAENLTLEDLLKIDEILSCNYLRS